MSANDRQVAGDHYQTDGEQHWDRQWKLHGRGYFVGCITKYVERYHKKNGVQDLEKAKHFLEKLIELEKEKNSLEKLQKDLSESRVNSRSDLAREIIKNHGNPYANITGKDE